MSTPHNEAKKEDIAKKVVMPGDPLRAKYIAEKYLDNYRLVNGIRGMYAYTGYYNGSKVTVMAHGMGMPSMGIYSYELYKFYDVEEIIRVGSCGSISNDLNINDIVLVKGAYAKSNYGVVHNDDKDELLYGNKILNNKIKKYAENNNIKLKETIIYCSDIFYNEKEDYKEIRSNNNCEAVEMESFALFHNAKYFNKKASCILTVSDNILTGEKLSAEDRETKFDTMIKLALDSI